MGKMLRILFMIVIVICSICTANIALSQKKTSYNVSKSLDERLVSAVAKNDISNVSKLIKAGANVNYVDKTGVSSLAYAVKASNKQMIELLLNNHADLNLKLKNAGNMTVLFIPLYMGNLEMCMFLLDKGADPNVAVSSISKKMGIEELMSQGMSPIMLLIASDKPDTLLLSKLIDQGGDINTKTDFGYSALLFALSKENSDVARFLIRKGADVNTSLSSYNEIKGKLPAHLDEFSKFQIKQLAGNSILHIAVSGADYNTIDYLLKAGAKLNSVNDLGETPLHLVCKHGYAFNDKLHMGGIGTNSKDDVRILELLIVKGANVNFKDGNGNTPLHVAASEGNYDLVKALLEHGADKNIKNKENKTAYNLAVDTAKEEVALLLKN